MSTFISQRLAVALSDLENAIQTAKSTIKHLRVNRPDLLARINAYEEVVNRQKVLAESVSQNLLSKKWEQVKRDAELIRGASYLIQLDTKSLIHDLTNERDPRVVDDFNA